MLESYLTCHQFGPVCMRPWQLSRSGPLSESASIEEPSSNSSLVEESEEGERRGGWGVGREIRRKQEGAGGQDKKRRRRGFGDRRGGWGGGVRVRVRGIVLQDGRWGTSVRRAQQMVRSFGPFELHECVGLCSTHHPIQSMYPVEN
jgi:hypothetical protein